MITTAIVTIILLLGGIFACLVCITVCLVKHCCDCDCDDDF